MLPSGHSVQMHPVPFLLPLYKVNTVLSGIDYSRMANFSPICLGDLALIKKTVRNFPKLSGYSSSDGRKNKSRI
jgi:hypothetical protein